MRKTLLLLALCLASLASVGIALAATGSGTNYSTTPSIGLYQPTPGVCGGLGVEPTGKSWLELINASFSVVDQHDHSPGHGQPVPTSGLNINADLSFNSNDAIGLRTTRFQPITLASLASSDVGALLVSGSDLYFVDGFGNQIRLTSAGGLAGAPGSIGGLVSPAAATYSPASKLFSFTSSSGYVANLSSGPLSIGDATVSAGKSATISVPAGLAANYTLTLPGSLPASTLPLTLSTTGAVFPATTLSLSGLTVSPSGASITGNSSVTGTLNVTGAATLGSGTTIGGATPITSANIAAQSVSSANTANSATNCTNATNATNATNLTGGGNVAAATITVSGTNETDCVLTGEGRLIVQWYNMGQGAHATKLCLCARQSTGLYVWRNVVSGSWGDRYNCPNSD